MLRQLHCIFLFVSLVALSVHCYSQEILKPLRFPTGEFLIGMEISDIQFTPDNQYLLLLSHENLYRLSLQDNIIEFLSPMPGQKMEWLLNNQYLISYSDDLYFPLAGKLDNGNLLQWPSLSVVKKDIHEFMISLDRTAILYKKNGELVYALFDLKSGVEFPMPPNPLLQFIGWDSNEKTVTGLEGEWKEEYQGLKIDPVWLNTRNYETNEIIHTVTLENAKYLQNYGSLGFYHNTYIREMDLIKPDTLLGVTQSHNTMYSHTSFIPNVWDIRTGKISIDLQESLPIVRCEDRYLLPYKISPQKRWMVVSSPYCNGLDLYNIKDDFIKTKEVLPRGQFAFSNNDSTLAIINDACTCCYVQQSSHLHTLDLATGEMSGTLYFNNLKLSLGAFSPDDETVVAGNEFCKMDKINFKKSKGIQLENGGTYLAKSAAFSPDGRRIVLSTQAQITQWDTDSLNVLASIDFSERVFTAITQYSPNGDCILLVKNFYPSYAQKNGNYLIAILDAQILTQNSTLSVDERHILSANFSLDGESIITAHQDNKVIIWDRRTGTKKQMFAAHSNEVVYAQFLADKIHAVSVDKNHIAYLWNIESGEIVTALDDLKIPVVYSPNWNLLFCGTQVWDLNTYKKIKAIDSVDIDLAGIAVSPSGNYLLTTTLDSVSKVWSIQEHILAPSEVNRFRLY